MKGCSLFLALALVAAAPVYAQLDCAADIKAFDEAMKGTLKASPEDVAMAKTLRAEAEDRLRQGDDAGCDLKISEANEMAGFVSGG